MIGLELPGVEVSHGHHARPRGRSTSAGGNVGFGRTFAVPGRCWRAGVLPKPAVPPSQDFGRITPVTALKASDSVDYDFPTIPPYD
jgi:hypothetical protein